MSEAGELNTKTETKSSSTSILLKIMLVLLLGLFLIFFFWDRSYNMPTSSELVPSNISISSRDETESLSFHMYNKKGEEILDWKKAVTWKSSDESVAVVDGEGLTVKIKAISSGTAIITVNTADISANAEVNVLIVNSIEVSPSSISLTEWQPGDLVALVKDDKGRTVSDASVNWRSENDSVVTVTSNGHIEAQSVGSAVIVASTVNGVSTRVPVSVQPREEAARYVYICEATCDFPTLFGGDYTQTYRGEFESASLAEFYAVGAILEEEICHGHKAKATCRRE